MPRELAELLRVPMVWLGPGADQRASSERNLGVVPKSLGKELGVPGVCVPGQPRNFGPLPGTSVMGSQ